MHSLRYQWHNDDPLYDGVPMLQSLQTSYIQEKGYVNLRCVHTLGCPSELKTADSNRTDLDFKNPTFRTQRAYPAAFAELFPDHPVPDVIGVACCAQFAVTSAKIRERPLADYIRYQKWLMASELEDEISGRVLEYSWHIIFGQEAVHCPDAATCYCRTFGLCNLDCAGSDKCGERWPFPPFSSLPTGWPGVGWDGTVRSKETLDAFREVAVKKGP
jgi:Protein of unknown function (DUF3431)